MDYRVKEIKIKDYKINYFSLVLREFDDVYDVVRGNGEGRLERDEGGKQFMLYGVC